MTGLVPILAQIQRGIVERREQIGVGVQQTQCRNRYHGIIVMESLSWNCCHGIIPERAGLGRTLKPISFHGQAHIPLSQGAPNPIQPGKQAKKLSRVHFKEEAKIQRSCSLFFPRFPSSFVSDLCLFSSHPRKHLAMLRSPMDPLTSPPVSRLTGSRGIPPESFGSRPLLQSRGDVGLCQGISPLAGSSVVPLPFPSAAAEFPS